MSLEDLEVFLNNAEISETPVFDGQIHRYKTSQSKSDSGWYVGHAVGDHKILIAGDWATDQKNYWFSKKRLTTEEKLEYLKITNEAKELARELRQKCYEQAKEKVAIYIEENKSESNTCPYLEKKQIKKPVGAIISKSNDLIIPMQDKHGITWSAQTIYDSGQKRFFPGGMVTGNYFEIKASDEKTIFICEGVATAQSIYECTGENVAAAFSANNMINVVEAFLERNYLIVLCADNDRFKNKNTGLEVCSEIVKKHSPRVKMVMPNFPQSDTESTDFNDLMVTLGKDEVRKQIFQNEIDSSGVEYIQYKDFFGRVKILQNSKKEILSGSLLTNHINKWEAGEWRSVLNEIGQIKSLATDYNLKPEKVQSHLERWIAEKKPELLIEIPEWDKKDRIKEMMDFVDVENFSKEESLEIIKEFCANIFARLNDPENQNRMIIFEGNQGLGKDTFIRNMFRGFGSYFCNSSVRDKEEDNYYVMDRSLIINISEFDRASKTNVAVLKNIITADSSVFRGAYQREASKRTFRCSFISSCNMKDVLRDSTGNRRYIFMELKNINWDYPKFSADESMQIVAQCRYLFHSGFKMSDLVNAKIEADSDMRTPDNPLDLALEYYDQAFDSDLSIATCLGKGYLTYKEASKIITEASKVSGVTSKTILSALKRTGRSTRDGGDSRKTRYLRKA